MTAVKMAKKQMHPPITLPTRFTRFSPRYRLIRTVTPMVREVMTKVTRLMILLPVATADMPASVPNWPTTRRSTAPYMAWRIKAPRMGTMNLISFVTMFP